MAKAFAAAVLLLGWPVGGFDAPLRLVGRGTYSGMPSIFLGAADLTSIRKGDAVLPVPLEEGSNTLLGVGRELQRKTAIAVLTGRDGGLWDALPWDMWGVASLPKRQALEMLERESKDYPNIFRTLAAAMKETCGGAGFLACALEDDYRGAEEGKVKIGGAVIIARDARFGGAAATGLGSTRLVECYADEAIALAQGLGLQLTCETELFDGACVPVASATFDGKGVAITVNEAKLPEASEADGKPNLPPHKASLHPAWEVKHADDYFKLTLAEKRALLARSGADVPRRGRGEAALDSALLPLLDENVRRDVQLMKALRAGDMERVSELSQNRSERGSVKMQLESAVADEDYALAAELQAKLDVLDRCRADITQDEGSYDPYLDADPWYLDNLEM